VTTVSCHSRSVACSPVEWNPWRELRLREHIVFRLAPLPDGVDGVYWPRGGRAAVIVDRDLDQRHRRAVLAHELIHDERGGGATCVGMPDSWDDVVARDELVVDKERARRLVPPHALRDFIEVRMTLDDLPGVTPLEVSEHFDVPISVAERALRLLADEPPGWEAV
jgi:hypothetical protein